MDESDLAGGLARISGSSGGIAGAGCLLGRRRVLTCAHVVEAALDARPDNGDPPRGTVRVEFPEVSDGDPMDATVVDGAWYPADGACGDVAVLELSADAPAEALQPPLRLVPSIADHRFRVQGFPADVDDAIAEGTIRGFTHGRRWAQLDVAGVTGRPVERGFSGAPVWDRDARAVVGIVVTKHLTSEAKTASMIPLSAIVRMWKPLDDDVGWRLRFDEQDLIVHWLPKARGIQTARRKERRRLFTGRSRALGELTSWLSPEPGLPARSRAVTGGPGSGKSAVIARLVMLADPDLRSEFLTGDVPAPDGIVDVAIHAKGKTLDQIVARIAAWCDVDATSADELVAKLVDEGRPRVIVVDALDEAPGNESQRIAMELLSRLASRGGAVGIRVLVGTRRGYRDSLLRKLGASMDVIDLDNPDAYFEQADLVEYVRRYLLEGGGGMPTAYAGRPELASRVATAVADRASPSFLIAQLASDALASRKPVDVNEAGWEKQLPETVEDAMESYLSEYDHSVRDLFRTLAFSEGTGLPRSGHVWAALAARLAQRATEPDVGALLESSAANYVVESNVDEESYYRLYHEALAEHLRSQDAGRKKAVHGTFTDVLLEGVPRRPDGSRDWGAAGLYARTHLASHAGRGGRLDELLNDPGYLLTAEPGRLLRSLPSVTTQAGVVAAGVYRRAAAQVRDKPAEEAASYLELHARQAGADELAKRITELDLEQPWRARWVHWLAPHAYSTVGQHGSAVGAIDVHTVDGLPLAVSGAEDGTIRIWDLGACQPLSAPLPGHEGRVTALATGDLDDEPIAVSAGWDQTLSVWSLRTGTRLGDPLAGHEKGVTRVAVMKLGDLPVAVSSSWDNSVRVWDLRRHEEIGTPLVGHSRGATAVAVGDRDGAPVAVSGGYESVRVWDLEARAELAPGALRRHTGGVAAVAIGSLGDLPVAVSGGWDQTLWLWNLRTFKPIGDEPLRGHAGGVTALAFHERGDGAVIVSGAEDGTVRTWDPATRESKVMEIGTPVLAVAIGEVGRVPVVVCGSEDGTVRMWELTASAPTEARQARGRFTSVALAKGPEASLVIAGNDDGSVSAWSSGGEPPRRMEPGSAVFGLAATVIGEEPVAVAGSWDGGVRAWRPLQDDVHLLGNHDDWVGAVAVGELGGRAVAVSGGADCSLRIWDLEHAVPIGEPLLGHAGTVTAVALGRVGEAAVVLSASTDRSVRLWRLDGARAEACRLLGEHRDEAWAVAFAALGGRQVALSGGLDNAVRLWDLNSGERAADPLRVDKGGVAAVAAYRRGGRDQVLAGCGDERLYAWDLGSRQRREIEIGSATWALATQPPSVAAAACTLGLVVIDVSQAASAAPVPLERGAVTSGAW